MEQHVVQHLGRETAETDHSHTSQHQSDNESADLTPAEQQPLVTELEKA